MICLYLAIQSELLLKEKKIISSDGKRSAEKSGKNARKKKQKFSLKKAPARKFEIILRTVQMAIKYVTNLSIIYFLHTINFQVCIHY